MLAIATSATYDDSMNRLPDTFSTPGLVDPHVHFREPGTNPAETIASGSLAAAMGGYAMVADMSNNPGAPTSSEAAVLDKADRIVRTSWISMAANGGAQPEFDNIGELEAMSLLVLLFKFYATITTENNVDYEASAFKEATAEIHRVAPKKRIGVHAGKENLADFIGMIAGDFGHPLLVHHINNPRDVRLVAAAKEDGLPVACAVTPHHLLKTSHDVRTQGWRARMMPELSDQYDSEELMRQLADGDIDIVETDHAPHPEDGPKSKQDADENNPDGDATADHTCFGVPGIELAAPLLFYQAERGFITMERLIDAMSTRPAEILGVTVSPNTRATWKRDLHAIEQKDAISGSGWTPYLGMLAAARLESLVVQNAPIISLGGHANWRKGQFVSARGAVI